jgi:protein-S-isoprenylcysteine O-methyltransferase Ste14
MSLDPKSRPNRIPWPPLIFLAMTAAAFFLELGIALPFGMSGWLRLIGWGIFAAGVGLDVWAMATMLRARTNILPNRVADRLVEHGPFAYTRNPIYAGNTIVMTGIGIAWNALWFIAFAAIAAALVQRLAIEREEAHLAVRFGEQWNAYAARVPRWIGRRGAANMRADQDGDGFLP